MTKCGRNLKITVDRNLREEAKRVFAGALGCETISPMPNLDVYKFSDGGSLGVFLVEPSEALTPAQAMKGAWLELAVDDPGSAHRALESAGLTPIEYHDKQHRYYQAPGGVVFRIAGA